MPVGFAELSQLYEHKGKGQPANRQVFSAGIVVVLGILSLVDESVGIVSVFR